MCVHIYIYVYLYVHFDNIQLRGPFRILTEAYFLLWGVTINYALKL